MDYKQTIQWIITALIRGAAFVVAAKFGKDAVSENSWAALADGAIAVTLAGVSIYSSIRARQKLRDAPPPK